MWREPFSKGLHLANLHAPHAVLTVKIAGSTDAPTVFDASVSADDGAITGWLFQPGDGEGDDSGSGHPGLITHQYVSVGDYDATLVIYDQQRAIGSSTITVSVATPPDPLVIGPMANQGADTDGPPAIIAYPAPVISGGVTPYIISATHASGSAFAVGVTAVTVTVSSVDKQTATAQFNVDIKKRLIVPPVSPTIHQYFETNKKHPKHFKSYSLRDQAQLMLYRQDKNLPPNVTFDPATDTDPDAQDAAKCTFPPSRLFSTGKCGNIIPNQVFLPLGIARLAASTALVVVDFFFTPSQGFGNTGITGYKWWQLKDYLGSGHIAWELQWEQRSGSTIVRPLQFDYKVHCGYPTQRSYNTSLLNATQNGPAPGTDSNVTKGDPVMPQAAGLPGAMIMTPYRTWVRVFQFFEFRASLTGACDLATTWVANEQAGPVKFIDRRTMYFRGTGVAGATGIQASGGILNACIEVNSSQDSCFPNRAPGITYWRNVQTFVGLTMAEVEADFLVKPEGLAKAA